MTRMLASVANVREAEIALAAGVDIIDIKDPSRGVLGAVAPTVARAIVRHVAGRCPTSATIGDCPMQAGPLGKAIDDMAATGVDIVKVGVFAGAVSLEALDVVCCRSWAGTAIVVVYFAELAAWPVDFAALARAGVTGVMLDTAEKTGGSLRSILKEETLMQFIRGARRAGLPAGLAGSLQVADIAPLLRLQPDTLGFRGALCRGRQRKQAIDGRAVRRVRAMIPLAPVPVTLRPPINISAM